MRCIIYWEHKLSRVALTKCHNSAPLSQILMARNTALVRLDTRHNGLSDDENFALAHLLDNRMPPFEAVHF